MPRQARPFWSLVDKNGECWLWTAGTNSGYGIYKSKHKSHRVAYELTYGEIPSGMCVCHRCDNPLCVKPDHLFLGTVKENNADRAAKGRSKGVFRAGAKHPSANRSGSSHWCAKLKDSDVLFIRKARGNGETVTSLAKQFGVHHSTISRIARGIWRTEI